MYFEVFCVSTAAHHSSVILDALRLLDFSCWTLLGALCLDPILCVCHSGADPFGNGSIEFATCDSLGSLPDLH